MAEEVTFSACFTNDKALNTEAGMSSQFLLGIPWGAAAQRVGSHCPCAATPASSLQQRLDAGAVGAGMGCFTECCNSSFPFCLFSRSCGAGAQDAGLCACMGWSQNTALGKAWIQLELLIELPLVLVTVGFHQCVSVMPCQEEGNCVWAKMIKIPVLPEICLWVR